MLFDLLQEILHDYPNEFAGEAPFVDDRGEWNMLVDVIFMNFIR